jgi:hypothetical protein
MSRRAGLLLPLLLLLAGCDQLNPGAGEPSTPVRSEVLRAGSSSLRVVRLPDGTRCVLYVAHAVDCDFSGRGAAER